MNLRGKGQDKEQKRSYTAARRQAAKSLALCVDCGAPPIPDNTRRETCAEKHRKSRRQSKERAIQQRNQASEQKSFL